MKSMILLLLLMPFAALAASVEATSLSAGQYRAAGESDLVGLLDRHGVLQVAPVTRPRLLHGTGQASPDTAARLQRHAVPAQFHIFDAWVELSADLDADGYFQRINVVFDADVDSALETVYVKLFLSRDGGDWMQLTTSDLFEIRYDSTADTYEVVSELIDGYPPGYYDVLVELHAINHAGVVASRIVQADDRGDIISLEDSRFDDPYFDSVTTVETTTVYGAGSVSLAGLLMYVLLLVIKLRYFRRPRRGDRA